MPRKLTLSNSSTDEYQLVAIFSNLRDYRITFSLNQMLGMDFVRYEDLAYTRSGQIMCLYPWYFFPDKQVLTSYYLIGNKHAGGCLIPSVKNADYFLFIKNMLDPDRLKDCLSKIRSIPNVITAMEVPVGSVRDMEALLDTNELHELEQLSGG
jgi:hypothetical protein